MPALLTDGLRTHVAKEELWTWRVRPSTEARAAPSAEAAADPNGPKSRKSSTAQLLPRVSSWIPVGGEPAMADDVRELLLSTTADADPSTPLSAPDLRLLIDHLRHRSDRLHASALSFASSNREPLASALLRAASSAASSASLQSSLQSALSLLSSSPDLSDLRSLSDRLVAARRELRERQEHLAAASSVASLSARLRAARASANPLDAAAAAAELKPLLVNPEGSGSGGDEPVVFGLLRGEWEQLVDEVRSVLVRGAFCMLGFVFVLTAVLVVSDDDAAASRTFEECGGVRGVCTGGREGSGEGWTEWQFKWNARCRASCGAAGIGSKVYLSSDLQILTLKYILEDRRLIRQNLVINRTLSPYIFYMPWTFQLVCMDIFL